MKLNSAGVLIAVMVLSTCAQEASQRSEPTSNAWDLTIVDASPESAADRAIPQSSVEVGLFRAASRLVRSRCDSSSVASPSLKPNTQTKDQFHSAEPFSFASPAARPCAESANRSGGTSRAQSQGPQSSVNEAQELAKKLSNPVASLISFPMQSNFDIGMGTGSGWRYTLNVQPVIPVALSPKWNMISRTIIPIIHQENVTGPNTRQNGLGDTVQSLFFSPNKSEPFIWAVGPVFLVPTATNASLGTQKWGVGPTVLALKQKKGWTYGVLANHIWSVAGKSNRSDVSATFVQPFLSYSTKDAWTYSINTESTYDWVSNSWSIPINPFVSKLVRFGKQPMSFGGGLKCWVTTPNGGPESCGLRIVITALFPKQ